MKNFESLIKLRAELKAPKGQYNKFGNYHYRSAEDVLEALKPLLAKHGLNCQITDEIILIGQRFYVKATVKVSGADFIEETTAFAREAEAKKGMDESQITGAASSYARKYALNGMFLIDDQKDADSTNTHGKEPEKVELTKVIADAIKTSTAMQELQNIWNGNPELHTNREFITLINQRKKQVSNA